jgi:hypothetical protein
MRQTPKNWILEGENHGKTTIKIAFGKFCQMVPIHIYISFFGDNIYALSFGSKLQKINHEKSNHLDGYI